MQLVVRFTKNELDNINNRTVLRLVHNKRAMEIKFRVWLDQWNKKELI